MSTPIETNTEQLQEVLQQVYNLPSRSGGSTTPDLVINYEEPPGYDQEGTYYDWTSIESMDFNGLVEKLQNQEPVNVHIKAIGYYGTSQFIGVLTPEAVYYSPDNNRIHVIWVASYNAAWDYGMYRMKIVIESDGSIYNISRDELPS